MELPKMHSSIELNVSKNTPANAPILYQYGAFGQRLVNSTM
ncbi:MAG: hypothetical protein ACLS3V_08630 [Streptococcus sp.]